MRFNQKTPSHFNRARKMNLGIHRLRTSEPRRPVESALEHLFEPLTRAELYEAGVQAVSEQPHFTTLEEVNDWVLRRASER